MTNQLKPGKLKSNHNPVFFFLFLILFAIVLGEFEGKIKRKGGDRVVKGYSSESDESSDKWRWDGRTWWHKVECKGPFALEAQSVQGSEWRWNKTHGNRERD